MVPQLIRNDVSSTKVRLFVRKGMSIEYLLPGCVSKYIRRHGLYQDGAHMQQDNGQAGFYAPAESSHGKENFIGVGKISGGEGSESSSEELSQEW